MRIIEILIFASLLLTWVFSATRPRGPQPHSSSTGKRRRAVDMLPVWTSGAGVALAALHLLVEGYRWQMVPGYALVGIFFLLALRRAAAGGDRPRAQRAQTIQRRGEPGRPMRLLRTVGRVLGGLAVLLLLTTAAALPALLPVYRLPQPTGPYPVGVTSFDWLDDSRPETLTDNPDDRRELVVRAWYPAGPKPGDRPAPYWPSLSAGGPAMMNNWHFPTFIPDHLRLVKTHSYLDAPLANAPAQFPVLFFSHGYGAIDESKNMVQMEELASHGYVIFSINHPYESLATIYDSGRVATLSEQARDNLRHTSRLHGRIDDWTNDTLFVMGQVERLQSGEIPSLLSGRLDLERQGVFGFSFGGATAAVVCLTDPRCDAGANLDGSLWGSRIHQEPLERPFLFFDSAESGGKNNDVFRAALGPVYNARIAASTHVNFSDICGWSPAASLSGLCGRIDARRMGRITNAYLLAFFGEYLQGKDSAALDGPAEDFPEVEFHARNHR